MKSVPGGPAKYDPNAFGTSEFMHFCRLVGAQPYLAANVRSLPAREFDQWIEYCNAPADATTYSTMRAAAGDRAPYGVRYWGVGNEAWGCGGNFTPQEYAEEFRRFTAGGQPRYGVDLRYVIGAQRHRPRMDLEHVPGAAPAARRGQCVGSLGAPLLGRARRRRECGQLRRPRLVRLAGTCELHGDGHRLHVGHSGGHRPPAPREAGDRRVGRVARQRADRRCEPLVRVAVHHPRRAGGGPHARPLPAPCQPGGDGERGAAHQLHPVGVPGA